MQEKQVVIEVKGVKKRYKLGAIGSGTLKNDLKIWWAKLTKTTDKITRIGEENPFNKNKTIMALDGIDFKVYKGERIGLIGHNGAGKTTLLKILSKITSPTEGVIKIKGKISSMLEVGTGFSPELTGRENIYLNGAILGMTKKEINERIDKIVEFSECAEFIDTPVKRYSSGMYVKLAFSVAVYLNSDIVVMDEVLAVGDISFQKKCIEKMNEIARDENRTIIYVSHNMETIRNLCDRCVVIEKGKKVFDGDVERAVEIYSNLKENSK